MCRADRLSLHTPTKGPCISSGQVGHLSPIKELLVCRGKHGSRVDSPIRLPGVINTEQVIMYKYRKCNKVAVRINLTKPKE